MNSRKALSPSPSCSAFFLSSVSNRKSGTGKEHAIQSREDSSSQYESFWLPRPESHLFSDKNGCFATWQ